MIPRRLFLIILAILYQMRKSLCSYLYPWVLYAEELDFIKTKTKDIALSSFRTFNNNVPQHPSTGKFDLKQTSCYSKIWPR